MLETSLYNWADLQAFRDPAKAPALLAILRDSDLEAEWQPALRYLESCASDEGVPSSMTAPLVSCLVSLAHRARDAKRRAILSSLEELTCGRGSELYSDSERDWLTAAIRELTFGLKLWVELIETATIDETKECVDLLAYCAERDPTLAERVGRYLNFCAVRFPELAPEVQAVREYFAPGAEEAGD